MSREKITLTLDTRRLEDLRRAAGVRGASAAVDRAIAAYLERLRHLEAVGDWVAELERELGPIPAEILEWASDIVDRWERKNEPTDNQRAV